jgi:hypothetical protein
MNFVSNGKFLVTRVEGFETRFAGASGDVRKAVKLPYEVNRAELSYPGSRYLKTTYFSVVLIQSQQ